MGHPLIGPIISQPLNANLGFNRDPKPESFVFSEKELPKEINHINAIHYSVRDNGVIRQLAAYVILGINMNGPKEVLTIQDGENERSKYWLSVLNELKTVCGGG